MSFRNALGLAAVLALPLLAGACRNQATVQQPVVPQISVQPNPVGSPGFRSPCAGGQPQMQYNCPQYSN